MCIVFTASSSANCSDLTSNHSLYAHCVPSLLVSVYSRTRSLRTRVASPILSCEDFQSPLLPPNYWYLFVFGLNISPFRSSLFFFLNDTAPPEISPLPLHAALPISGRADRRTRDSTVGAGAQIAVLPLAVCRHSTGRCPAPGRGCGPRSRPVFGIRSHRCTGDARSEEHTSELQPPDHLLFLLLLEKK